MTVSPEGNRLFVVCQSDPNNVVDAFGTFRREMACCCGSDTLPTPVHTIALPVSLDNSSTTVPNAENGCKTPVDYQGEADQRWNH